MTVADLEHFRNLLHEREHNISEWLQSPDASRADDVQKAQALLAQIREALGRVDEKTFGTCLVCQGEVQYQRLEVQPLAQVCLECISRQEQEQLEEELYLAGKIHRALLPQSVAGIDGFEVAVKSLAARVVGGDYYDFIPATDGGMARIVIADAMGKGLPAGLVMSNIQGALRVLAEEFNSPSALVSRLNRWLCHNVPLPNFVSLACVAIEPRSGGRSRLAHTNAGHCPPILVRDGGLVELLHPTGGVLGVHEGFDFTEHSLELDPGDMLLLYTDGVIEADDGKGQMFGEERLTEFLKKNHGGPLESILGELHNSVQSFVGKPELADDYTTIAVRKLR